MSKPNQIEQHTTAVVNDPRWALVMRRDKAADGSFCYSVVTTGVYCRPSCAARKARPENVHFFRTTAEAENAGYRPCKRCKPTGPSLEQQYAATIRKVCRFLERSEGTQTLKQLAEFAGMSVFHLHRTFKTVTGVTPRQYAAAQRAERLRAALTNSGSVTAAIYEAGFSSSSRFYAKSNMLLGMTPTNYRDGGAHQVIHFAIGECSLGAILVAKSERGICAILMDDEPYALLRDLQDRFPRAEFVGNESGYEELVARVVGLVEKPGAGLDLPLDIRGTVFQQRVWKALQQIPSGSTATYTDIAKQIGMPKAVRAVAQACGANSMAVAIPCHRVIRTDGSLSGYRWGVERKRALLEREARR